MNEKLYDKTVRCIRCGFCLEACPTFVITGRETDSPRGRIYLVRSAIEGEISWQDTVKHLDACVGCRACETACPSGVEYGAILELARERLEPTRQPIEKLARTITLAAITGKARRLLAALPIRKTPWLLSKALSGQAPQAEIPRKLPRQTLPETKQATKGTVALLKGCAMDTYYGAANDDARWLLQRHGYHVVDINDCCGALHKHAGRQHPIPQTPHPIIVTAAGCGSHLKDEGVSAYDLTEFLAGGFEPPTTGKKTRIAYQDACHLLHGQKIAEQPRKILDSLPGVERVEIDDTCCGSAGIYNLTQPEMARILLEKKWQAIEEAQVEVVVTANPGCLAWISQAAREHKSPVRVQHFASFVAERCHNLQA